MLCPRSHVAACADGKRQRSRSRFLLACLSIVSLVIVGCGGSSSPTGPSDQSSGTGTGNVFSAIIDGTAWSSDANHITVTGSTSPTRAGTLVISGYETASGTTLSLTLSFVGGPSTQPLGVNINTTPGGIGMVAAPPASWTTPLDGAAGTITLSKRTSTEIAGTFSFTATASVGATGTRNVTAGSFDITMAGGLPAMPTGTGSVVHASIDGTPWNAATIVGSNPGSGIFTLEADNTEYSVTLIPTVPVVAGTTYGIPSQMSLTVIRTGTSNSWAATSGVDVGSVTITTFDAHRLVASFDVTLPPQTASGSLSMSEGAIDAYLQ